MNQYNKVMENRQKLVDKILDNLDKGYVLTPPLWNKGITRPFNPISSAVYRGGNAISLYVAALENGYDDNRWMTFKQAQSKGYKIQKGAKGVFCEKWIFDKLVTKTDELTGETIQVREKLDKPIANYFYVYNASQIDGIEPLIQTELSPSDTLSIADDLIMSSECPVFEMKSESRAYYSPTKDEIHLPSRHLFKDDISFLDVAVHEMGHSTGHETRMNRDLKNSFGSKEYAIEELRAEFASYFVGADLNVNLNNEHLQDHTNYISSWKEVLKDEPKVLYKAINDADLISQHLIKNYNKCIDLKKSLNSAELPSATIDRLTKQINDNQIKNIIKSADITPHHKQMLNVMLEQKKDALTTPNLSVTR